MHFPFFVGFGIAKPGTEPAPTVLEKSVPLPDGSKPVADAQINRQGGTTGHFHRRGEQILYPSDQRPAADIRRIGLSSWAHPEDSLCQ